MDLESEVNFKRLILIAVLSMDRVCGTCIRLVSKAVSQPGTLVHERS